MSITLDEGAVAALKDLRTLAEANPLSRADMLGAASRFAEGDLSVGDLNRRQTIELDIGVTVTLTLEWQPMGTCRHLSMAPASPRAPSPDDAIAAVAPLLGLDGVGARQTWMERMADGNMAVNVIEVVTPPAN